MFPGWHTDIMAAALPPGEQHEFFIKWANKQGIEMNGVALAKFAGRGIGIVAARDLIVSQVLEAFN